MKNKTKYNSNISNVSNLTSFAENSSNRNKNFENTNDALFNPKNEFILNKKMNKKNKKSQKKKKLYNTFFLKRPVYYDEFDEVNMEKWYKNRIKIFSDEENDKKNIYKLYSDDKVRTRSSLLKAEKENGIYVIRKDMDIVGKIRWNLFSSHFKVYDSKDNLMEEIIFNFNFMGLNGPTKLHIYIPKTTSKSKSWSKTKNRNLLHKIESKSPEYNDMFNIYTLKFIRRKVIPNEKNLQLIYSEYKEDNNNILLQFAQVHQNEFILDYKYPFNNIIAFAVAITAFTSRTFFK
jgi:hypothetical protein